MAAIDRTEPAPHVVTPRFVGRRAERSLLEQALATSRRESQVVLVEGEAGIGKSRLLDEISRLARAAGQRVLVGGCVSLDDEIPLAPIAEALRGLAADITPAELSGLLGPARGVLGGLVPGLAEVERTGPGTELVHATSQQRLLAVLVDLMARLARDQPLVLIIEDIHWADAATLELLSLLSRNLRRASFALLLSMRTDEAAPHQSVTSFVAELERSAHPVRLRLPRFNRGEVIEQLAAMSGAARPSAELVETIVARSDGNPFYIEELHAARLTADSALPDTLEQVLKARLGALSSSSQHLVAAAAVRPRESSEDELQAVAVLDDDDFSGALHELLDRNIFERRRIGGREVVAFRHALIKAAAYDQLLNGERRRLHVAYALLLEGPASDQDPYTLAELAGHWEAAGDDRRALGATLRAAAAADAAHQASLALEQYERALRVMDRAPGDPLDADLDRFTILERAALAAGRLGSPKSIEYLTAAIDLVDASVDAPRAGRLYERLGRFLWYGADGEAALAAYREAVRLVPMDPPSAIRARVCAGLAQLLMILARFDESLANCDEALANARSVGDHAIEAHATDTMGVNVAYLGDPDRGAQLIWTANAMAADAGDDEEVARTYLNLVDVLLLAGRFEEAASLGVSSYAYCADHGLHVIYGAGLLVYAAWAMEITGRWAEALEALERARAQQIDVNTEIMSLAVSGMVEACRGDLDTARAHLGIAQPLISGAIDIQLILPYAEAEADLALADGRPDAALASVLEGIAHSEPLVGGSIKRYGPVFALGLRAAADIVEASAGDAQRRSRAAAEGAALMTAMDDAYRQVSSHHAAHLKLAEPYLALCRAEWTRVEQVNDPAAWEHAAAQMALLGRPYLVAYSRYRQAEATVSESGRTTEVGRALAEAHSVALDLGAIPLRRAIERLARRARVNLGRASDARDAGPARFGLTEREMEVLRLLAKGRTNREIGAELFISEKTASVHVSNLLAKLGATRRSEAAAVATRLGIADEQPPLHEGRA